MSNAKQRYISCSFWDDPWIMELDPSEKLLYLYFMTNPLTNIAGVYKIAEKRVAFDTGFNTNTIGHIMHKFQKKQKVVRYGEYLIIPSWPKHQRWETSPKIRQGIESCLKELPEDVLLELIRVNYRFDLKPVMDTLSIVYPYPSNYSDSDSDSDSDRERDRETEGEPRQASAAPALPEESPPSPEDPPSLQDPRQPATDLASEWYREYSRRTTRLIAPGEDDIKAAWGLLQRTDLPTARDAIPIYFDCDAWFMFDRGKKTKRYSFRSFCQHFTELSDPGGTKLDLDNLEAVDF